MNKIYLIFDFTYNVQFYLIWTTNENTVVPHRKENFIKNGKRLIFFYISYFNLAISSLCIIISILVKITRIHSIHHFFFFFFFWLSWNVCFFTVKSLRLLQFSCYEKNKECFGKPDKFRKFSLAFFQIWFSFSTIGEEKGKNWIKFEFLFIVTFGKTCEKTKSKLEKKRPERIF